jgi:Arc/MetJ-type ribon-helix-helix transcriptional regulator
MVENENPYSIGEGPATRVSLSLPEGTAEAIRRRVGKREFSSFITAAVERELRGQILDEYLADYERRNGPVSASEQDRARQVFDEVFAEESSWPAAS